MLFLVTFITEPADISRGGVLGIIGEGAPSLSIFTLETSLAVIGCNSFLAIYSFGPFGLGPDGGDGGGEYVGGGGGVPFPSEAVILRFVRFELVTLVLIPTSMQLKSNVSALYEMLQDSDSYNRKTFSHQVSRQQCNFIQK
jgi:hypothetical protein